MAAVTADDRDPSETSTMCSQNGLSVLLSFDKLKLMLEDETYFLLKENFLTPHGRGRPKKSKTLPSSLLVTHRLLMQLHLLKSEDEQCTFADLHEWLCQLDPTLAHVTKSRISHHVTSVVKNCLHITEDAADAFLNQEFDFHVLCTPLSSVGLNRLHLMDVKPFAPTHHILITNSIVRALEHFQEKEALPMSFVIKWIKKLDQDIAMSDAQLRSKILSICKKVRMLVKNKKTEALDRLLAEPFFSTALNTPPCSIISNSTSKTEKECKDLKRVNDALQNKILQKDMQITVLKEERQSLLQENDRLTESELMLNEKIKETKSLIRLLKEREQQLDHLSQSRTYKNNVSLRKEIKEAIGKMTDLNCENEKLKVDIVEMKKNLKRAQKGKSSLKRRLQDEKDKMLSLTELQAMTDEEKECSLKNDHSNRYKNSIRLAYMDLQGKAGVAATKCSDVVQIVSKHFFGKEYLRRELPSASSALNFADEAHHIAMHQVVDEIKKSDHYTYASDGTSRQKQHYLERHIILADKTQLSIGFTEVASDDANTLLEKTIELLHELSSIYSIDSKDEEEKKDDVFKELVQKMKCLMSDRAAVNKSFNKKMAEFRREHLQDENVTTHFIYCNAHFLLGLAQATQEALNVMEQDICKEESCSGLGRDLQSKFASFTNSTSESAAIRLIRTASECLGPRCDEKSGSRSNWLAYCDEKKIRSKFSSYRNNRFNNIFENASATLYHHQHVTDFLSKANFHSNLKLQSVTSDALDDRVLAMIGAVALFNIIVTGSYWKLMNSYLPYGSFPQYVRKLDAKLDQLATHGIDSPVDVTSVFEDFIIQDDATIDLMFNNFIAQKNVWQRTLKTIAMKCQSVLRRQLKDFLEGEVYGNIDYETKQLLDTCPLTNLSGERLFGDLDYDMLKRRHATTHHRSSVTMWKHNNTAAWLESQPKKRKAEIMDSAVKHRKVLRKKHLESVRRQREIIKSKLAANREKMQEKEIKDAEMRSSILDGIITDGGLCKTKEELDDLFRNSTVESLKTQLKYRKVFQNNKHVRLTGTKSELYQSLLNIIGMERDHNDNRSEGDEA